ncbi:MAG: class I SAM-dependent methyltransferase [Microthrixaceae bacterium]|nr:class I SAM-dependent methyltransferase [Microthrixaceae bacterium]
MSDINDIDQVRALLEESRAWGFLGPGPVDQHITHSMTYVHAITGAGTVMDLGSGGGVPGLVLAEVLSTAEFVLLDSNIRRCEFLRHATEQLGMTSRVRVVEGRAEELARDDGLRHRFDAVVARSFGPPSVVAECAVGFLNNPGVLVVSEPPGDTSSRWDAKGLEKLGLAVGERISTPDGSLQVIQVVSPCDGKYPRKTGTPAKRPLF